MNKLHKMETNMIIRQGDVLLIPCSTATDVGDEIKRDNGRVVLAYGEVTGHAHAFNEPHVTLYSVKKSADRVLKVVGNVAYLRHEEHTHIPVQPGTYIVRRQVEWTDANEPIQVAD